MKCPGYSRAIVGDKGLRLNESIGFRCALDKGQHTVRPHATQSPLQFVQNRLSRVNIKAIPNIERTVPNTANLTSFLIKNETKYLGVIKQSSNSEEFKNIVSTHDPHMTIVLTWKAIVSDNNSMQRIAFGQNFVQLRHLYET